MTLTARSATLTLTLSLLCGAAVAAPPPKAPSPEEAVKTVRTFADGLWPDPRDPTRALIGAPFRYAGAEYYDPDKAPACKRKYGTHGTIRDVAGAKEAIDCLALGIGSLGDGGNAITVVTPKTLPKQLRRHAKMVRGLRGVTLVSVYFESAGPARDWYLVVVATGPDGLPRVTGIAAHHECDGCG